MRSKETSDDYRYFPEPDLPPLHVERAWLDGLRAAMPELPAARRARYEAALGLSGYDAAVLVGDPDATALFEATLAADAALHRQGRRELGHRGVPAAAQRGVGRRSRSSIRPELAALIRRGRRRRDLAGATARRSSRRTWRRAAARRPRSSRRAASSQISDAGALGAAVDEVLAANPAAVADYRAGKAQAVGFLVGQVMKATRGQANAALAQRTVRERLDARRVGEATTAWDRSTSCCGRPAWCSSSSATRGPRAVARYQALKEQDANVARYEAWRGGLRDDGQTGASIAMARAPAPGPAGGSHRARRRGPDLPGVPHPLISPGPGAYCPSIVTSGTMLPSARPARAAARRARTADERRRPVVERGQPDPARGCVLHDDARDRLPAGHPQQGVLDRLADVLHGRRQQARPRVRQTLVLVGLHADGQDLRLAGGLDGSLAGGPTDREDDVGAGLGHGLRPRPCPPPGHRTTSA